MKSNIRVCVADDHPIFRKGLTQILAMEPSIEIVGEAESGTEALSLSRSLKPDILIADITMPSSTGLEVAQAAQQEQLSVRIIFLTMHKDCMMFNEALNLGVKGYVLKDSTFTDIVKATKAVFAGSHFVSSELTGFILNRNTEAKELKNQHPSLDSLTTAERRILKMVASDRTTKEIADDLDVSPRTVGTHRTNISTKLGLRGSHSLLKFAFENRSKL